jgi:FAD/FMN-containing dehydrogenase
MAHTLAPSHWKSFRDHLSGRLVQPSDEAYAEARKVWNGMIDMRPAGIAYCASVDDVRRGVEFGQEHGLELAMRCGGHSAAGLSMTEGGLVLDLTPMHQVTVDPNARTARAGGGMTWGQFDAATTAHDLATTGGVISTTGIAGLTLGGGIGNLMRQHGLACDNLREAQVVLASGDVVTANAQSHPDLYWALRGGGGNFGVVTEFTYDLHPVSGMVGGMIVHPRDRAREVVRHYREVASSAPDALALFCALLHSPDGDPIAAYLPWYNGSEQEAEGPLRALRSFGPPLADMTGPTSYTAAQTALDEGFPPGMQVYWKSHFLSDLSDEAIDVFIEHANAAPSKLSAGLLETLGGAVARVDPGATAFPHRSAPYNLAIIARWLDPAEADANIAWARAFFDAMQPFASGVYVNYMGVGDGAARIQDAYAGETWQRLRAIKAEYDLENLFHRNLNIPPA